MKLSDPFDPAVLKRRWYPRRSPNELPAEDSGRVLPEKIGESRSEAAARQICEMRSSVAGLKLAAKPMVETSLDALEISLQQFQASGEPASITQMHAVIDAIEDLLWLELCPPA